MYSPSSLSQVHISCGKRIQKMYDFTINLYKMSVEVLADDLVLLEEALRFSTRYLNKRHLSTRSANQTPTHEAAITLQ